MDKKSHLLSHLKKQVIALKTQLQCLQKHRQPNASKLSYHSRNNRSVSHSSRFNSVSLDSTYLERGIKKFNAQGHKFKNISQLINEKSKLDRTPVFSSQRKAEIEKTRENFSSDKPERSKTRSRSPNPLTGYGYQDHRSGKKTSYEPRREAVVRPSNKKHFNLYW